MKQQYASLIIFITLVTSSALASIGSYRATERRIVDDLNNALANTLAEKRNGWLTTDTIKAYRRLQGVMDGNIALSSKDNTFCRYLTIPQLRGVAYVRLDVMAYGESHDPRRMEADGHLCSDTVVWRMKELGASVAVRSYARCTVASVFGMSDQRLPFGLCLSAMLWAVLSVIYFRKNTTAVLERMEHYGGLVLSADGKCFCNALGEPVKLTPMQHRLMRMFFDSPSRCLSKQEICDALWPRKENADDTLYTLIRRLKPVLETSSDLRIEAERGRAYRLTVKEQG